MYDVLKVNLTYSNEYNQEDYFFKVDIQAPDQFDSTRRALVSFCLGVETVYFGINDEVTTGNEPQANIQRATVGLRTAV